MKYLILLFILIDVTIAFSDTSKDISKEDSKKLALHFELISNDFKNKGNIPLIHACHWLGGENKSPHLAWSSPPENTKNFVLIMIDRGNKNSKRETNHWSVYNIPNDISSFSPGEELENKKGIVEGKNYEGKEGYAGPCPSEKHLYRFILFALNKEMPIIEKGLTLSETDFKAIYEPHILGSAKLEGYFEPSTLRLFINKIKRTLSNILN